jgi:hypothetical protein
MYFFLYSGKSGGTRVIQKGFSSKRRTTKVRNDDETVEGDEKGDEKENFDENDDKNVDENGDENENGDEKENGDESPSFYVADDEKSIAIVDLLLESRDKT